MSELYSLNRTLPPISPIFADEATEGLGVSWSLPQVTHSQGCHQSPRAHRTTELAHDSTSWRMTLRWGVE